MINRIFLIADTVFQAGENLPEGDNIYFSVLVDPSEKGDLENVYSCMGTKLSQFALTLDIKELPSAESIRFIASFLFLPSYLKFEQQPVINLAGNSQELLGKTASALSGYLSVQGISNVIINSISPLAGQPETKNYRLFDSSNKLLEYYKKVLQSVQYYNNDIFFQVSSNEPLNSTLSLLQQVENDFKQSSPKLYSLVKDNRMLEKEISSLKRKIIYTEAELSHQKQYSDILRSNHSTKELQDYYNHEYEILPKWYKRFGHILKVITGKRTFRSLFSDDVKKYKD